MKTQWQGYSSILANPISQYLATKRALGCKFENEDRTLRLFDAWLVEHRIQAIESITGAQIHSFLTSRPRPNARSYNALLSVVRRLFEWLVDQQMIEKSPIQSDARRESDKRRPFLFDEALIRRLLAAAGQLPDNSRARLRGPTYEMLLALIATLGLRISEAARLQCGDVDLEREVLEIRNTKFGKSRLVPFGCRLSQRLRNYIAKRESHGFSVAAGSPLFSWDGTTPISTNTIRNTFRDYLVPQLAIEVPPGTCGPKVHGLRHSFAVRTLLRWYQNGHNPAERLHYLSTFMGHVNLTATASYLTITSDLLQAANQRFERFVQLNEEERP